MRPIPCKGFRDYAGDFECAYANAPECERCVCAGGNINPNTGRAATQAQRIASLKSLLDLRDEQLRQAEERISELTGGGR